MTSEPATPDPRPSPWITVLNPATDEVVGRVRDHDAAQAMAAVDRAEAAFDSWRATAPRTRSEVLRRVHDLVIEQRDRLADLVVSENGKTLGDARSEITYAADFFRWYAEEAVRPAGSYGEAPAGGSRTLVTHQPVGVAALVTPWNFPAAMIARKVAPALAAGCAVVVKPAEETPMTAVALQQIMREAGVPDGVVEVVPTTQAPKVVTAWLQDRRVRKVSFTGSTAVGKILLRQAADRVVASSMELGGNAPFIVAADADLDAAIAGAVAAKLRGGGQACTAANTFFVHRSRVEEFTDRFGSIVEGLVVGPGSAPGVDVGPVITRRAAARIQLAVDEAVGRGAVVTHRATIPSGSAGYYVAPMVVRGAPIDSVLVTEEIFGPIAPILAFDDVDEVVAAVNAREAGLAAYIYAADLKWAVQVSERLQVGMVGINRGVISDASAPFGGMKESGLGREGARDGIEAFRERQYISVGWD